MRGLVHQSVSAALAGWLSAACSSGVNIAPPDADEDVSTDLGDAADDSSHEVDAASSGPSSSKPVRPSSDAGVAGEPSPSAKPTGPSLEEVITALEGAGADASSSSLIFPEMPPGAGGSGSGPSEPMATGGTGDWPTGGAAGSSGGSSSSSADAGGGGDPEPVPPWSESNEIRIDVAQMLTAAGCADYPLSEPILFRFRLDEFEEQYQSLHVLAPSVFAEYDHTQLVVESADGGAAWPSWLTIGMNVVESVTVLLVGEVPVPASFSETLVVSRDSDACPLLAVPLQIDFE